MYLPMKQFFQAPFLRVAAVGALACGLVACGGGSVGPVTVAPYVPGSAEAGAFTALQAARTSCGFGAVTRDTQLDAAALAHDKYMVDLSFATGTHAFSHTETFGVAGFTGVDLGARASHQGYDYEAVAEILEATSWDYDTQQTFHTMAERGASSMRNLMNTVYHLSGAMYEGSDVGMGAYLDTKKITNTTWREEYRFGALVGYRRNTSPIVMGARVVASYPCANSTNIPPSFAPADESPNPFPSYTISSQLVGPPIYVKVDAGQTLALTSYSIRLKNGAAVPTVLIDYAYDQRVAKEVGIHEAFVVPNVALTPNATYQVSLNGSINGTAFPTRSFEFSTGP
jgi:hypothetical protein